MHDWHDLISSIAGTVGALATVGIWTGLRRLFRTIDRHDLSIDIMWAEVFGSESVPPSKRERK